MDIFSGDPYLTLGKNGSRLTFKGGQPVMDQGLENMVLISLFTKQGWPGNVFFTDPNEKIGSDFIESTRQPITLSALVDIEQAAIRALDNPVFGKITVTVTNPTSDRLNIKISIEPPGQDSSTILLTRNGLNWQAQALNPAHGMI
jgi:phage gp46-like protein